jgi:hypothetical protein
MMRKTTRVVLSDNEARTKHFLSFAVFDRKSVIVVNSLQAVQGIRLGPDDVVYDLGVEDEDLRALLVSVSGPATWVEVRKS